MRILLLIVGPVASQPRTTGYILPLSAPLVNLFSVCVCARMLQPDPPPRLLRLNPHLILLVSCFVKRIRAVLIVRKAFLSAAEADIHLPRLSYRARTRFSHAPMSGAKSAENPHQQAKRIPRSMSCIATLIGLDGLAHHV